MESTITERVIAFRERPRPRTLYDAFRTVARQRRLTEAAYSAAQFLLFRPSLLKQQVIPSALRKQAEQMLALTETCIVNQTKSRYPLIDQWVPDLIIRPHCATQCGSVTLVGEYDDEARLILLKVDGMVVCDYYRRERGVRHIHFVHALDEHRFIVSTGDSTRVLDLWSTDGEQVRFEKRLIHRFAGFTGVATVRGETYLGSDFSSRPNYLLRLSDRRKFFLPQKAFFKWIWIIEPVSDRFLLVGGKNLEIVDNSQSVSIFDTVDNCYVEAF